MSAESETETGTGPTSPAPSTPGAARRRTIGYVLKMYPRFSETFVVSEILAREAAGERVVIFSLRPTADARFHPELARVEAPVVHLPRATSGGRLWERLAAAAEDPQIAAGLSAEMPELLAHGHDDAQQAVDLAAAARDHDVDHLHAHFASMATTVARLASRITGVPYSFTAHAKDIHHDDVDQRALETKLAEAHHAVTISAHNLDDLRRRFPAATRRLHLVHNGLELERFPFRPRVHRRDADDEADGGRGADHTGDADDGPIRLLGVGRLVEKKGFGLLVEAVARLRARGLRAEADIAGDGPLAEGLREQIAAAGLTEHVRLLGPRTQREISMLFDDHDAFVAPFVVGHDGNVDGLPTVLLEAMARGIRCVAADVAAVAEVIRPGRTGWLVPSGDVDALVEAIVAATAAPAAEHRELLESARRLVEERFDSTGQALRLRALVDAPAAELESSDTTVVTESTPAAPAAALVGTARRGTEVPA
ncbi:glycosyltransferase family 4 protein [Nesterenkonia halophila]|uniref:glycosyltransferase n=1 Tax=Nesterenkonia halophila TaxID=302044 RepID=UPI001291B2ED|nr:glycosyltransferase [Nesterenkonia halophila]